MGECVHIATSMDKVYSEGAAVDPDLLVELITARGHQHVGGLGMEMYNERTGQLLCASKPRYGKGSAAGDEFGYMVGVPPCVWGPPPMRPPPRLRAGDLLRTVSRYNSTEGHLGVMGFWFMQIALVPKEKTMFVTV